MTYQQTVDYLFTKLPMFSRIGSSAFKKDLTNIKELCRHLGDPQSRFKSIHVAGTNGKGSVSHMIAAVLQTAGYKTGLYTSPHFYDFRERIKINGEMISEEYVIHFVESVKLIIEEIEPSFFEITVAMAFDYFAKQEVDIAVIEIGLGGRLDSTNIITPEVSVITNIGWDHMNMLGNSLQEIAFEKAGIIKRNVPVVVGEKKLETEAVFRQVAEERKTAIFFAEDYYSIKKFDTDEAFLKAIVEDKTGKERCYRLDLNGIYQLKNLITVLKTVDIIQSTYFNITEERLIDALEQTKKLTGLQGRWEVIREQPKIVLEVAHNEDGITEMLRHLQHIRYKKLHFIFGIVKDKEIERLLHLLPKDATYYFTQAHIPRALAAQELYETAKENDLNGDVFENVNDALVSAKQNAEKDDVIIVCGSIFLVAEVDRSNI